MISDKTKHQFLYNSMRATRLAYLDLARNMFCKKWAELRGNTQNLSFKKQSIIEINHVKYKT
jgi:hypothetical protein